MSQGHSAIGPSGAKRWMACPGSVKLSEQAPPESPSEHAAEGTVAHYIAEQLVSGKATYEQLAAKVGETIMSDDFEIEVTDEMVEAAGEYLDSINIDKQMFALDDRPLPVIERVEQGVRAGSVDAELHGTVDHVLYRKDHKLIIRDYKYGKGVRVDADENEQMAAYAVAVMDSEAGWAFEEVELVIFQPRNGGERRWATTVEWLRQFQAQLKTAVAATREPNAKLEAGTHCRWCKARAFCPAVNALVQKEASAAFDEPAPPKKTLPQLVETVRLMPVENLVRAFMWEGAIESYMEAVKAVLRDKLEAGEDVPGLKLVEGRAGNRKWKDEGAVEAEYGALGDVIYEPKKLLSPAKLEKIVGKGKVKTDLIERGPAPKSIALASDPRPAVSRSAAEAFTELETTATALVPGKPGQNGKHDPLAGIA